MKKKIHNVVLISDSLKALAHPSRINILSLLVENEKVKISVSEISTKLKLSQPETSRHLSILKNKKILVSERVGANIYYSVNKKSMIFNCIENLLNKR